MKLGRVLRVRSYSCKVLCMIAHSCGIFHGSPTWLSILHVTCSTTSKKKSSKVFTLFSKMSNCFIKKFQLIYFCKGNLQEYSICQNENSKLLFIWQTCVKIAKVLLYLRFPNGYLDNYLWLWVPTEITWFMTSGSCVWFFLFLFQMGNSTWWPFVYVFFFSSEFLFDIHGICQHDFISNFGSQVRSWTYIRNHFCKWCIWLNHHFCEDGHIIVCYQHVAYD
jgi:hypothetical protein